MPPYTHPGYTHPWMSPVLIHLSGTPRVVRRPLGSVLINPVGERDNSAQRPPFLSELLVTLRRGLSVLRDITDERSDRQRVTVMKGAQGRPREPRLLPVVNPRLKVFNVSYGAPSGDLSTVLSLIVRSGGPGRVFLIILPRLLNPVNPVNVIKVSKVGDPGSKSSLSSYVFSRNGQNCI